MSSMKPMAVRVPPLKPHVLPSKPLPWLGGEPLGWSVAPQLCFKTPPRAITLSSLSIGFIGGFIATLPERARYRRLVHLHELRLNPPVL